MIPQQIQKRLLSKIEKIEPHRCYQINMQAFIKAARTRDKRDSNNNTILRLHLQIVVNSKEKLFKSTKIHSFLSVLFFSVVRLPLDLWRDIIKFTLRIFRHIKIRCTFVRNGFICRR